MEGKDEIMSKRKKNRTDKRIRSDPIKIATEIKQELRGILRRIDELKMPFTPEFVESRPDGNRFRIRHATSYERIHEDICTLAGMVWHLKDRIGRWFSATGRQVEPSLEDLAASNTALCVCADLIDSKKHGGGCNRSGHSPKLNGLKLAPNGPVQFRYDGALKVAEIHVPSDDPIPYVVQIVSAEGHVFADDNDVPINAIDLICTAFDCWNQLLAQTMLLSDSNPEDSKLFKMLNRFKERQFPVFQSDLIPTL